MFMRHNEQKQARRSACSTHLIVDIVSSEYDLILTKLRTNVLLECDLNWVNGHLFEIWILLHKNIVIVKKEMILIKVKYKYAFPS